jgi:hypothetical protein
LISQPTSQLRNHCLEKAATNPERRERIKRKELLKTD